MADVDRTGSASIHEALDALEAAWIEPESASTRALVELAARRRSALDRLATHDLSALDPREAARVKARLERLTGRDRVLLETVVARRDQVRDALGQIVQGRATVRGYRRGSAAPPPSFASKL